ncbi:MAG: transposase [bacterium]|nr:transposase [candidate division KSB1 bacterium]MDH7559887.1 transposase [bacterium]
MCPYDPTRHHRRSIRLKGYDYTQPGAYFITIVTHDRTHLFGRVVDGVMRLNALGEMVREEWFKTARIRPYVPLRADEFVVMPNHIHGIIWIVDVGATRRVAPTSVGHTKRPCGPVPSPIGAIVCQFKSAVTKRTNALSNTYGVSLWQRNYYEHIIRNDKTLEVIRQYIAENPLRLHLDRYNPERTGDDPLAQKIWETIQGAQQRGTSTSPHLLEDTP